MTDQSEREQIVAEGLAALKELMQWWAYLTTYREAAAAMLTRRGGGGGRSISTSEIRKIASEVAEEIKP
jgi:hypothetical protein